MEHKEGSKKTLTYNDEEKRMRKLLKKGIATVMAVAMTLSGVIITGGNVEKVQAADEYKLVWSDEFEGDSLDRSKWIVEVNGDGGGNDELQYYVDSTDNISVSDGTLKITAKRQDYNG